MVDDNLLNMSRPTPCHSRPRLLTYGPGSLFFFSHVIPLHSHCLFLLHLPTGPYFGLRNAIALWVFIVSIVSSTVPGFAAHSKHQMGKGTQKPPVTFLKVRRPLTGLPKWWLSNSSVQRLSPSFGWGWSEMGLESKYFSTQMVVLEPICSCRHFLKLKMSF